MGIQLANGNTFFIFKKTGVIDIERSLDYFYGQAGELFSFYRIPKALFQEQRFQTLSTDAKTLYGILLDRMSLSAKNGWLDEQGRVFIIFTIEDVKRALCCADNKATKMLRELEEFGLIERKRRGLGKPSLVYVKNFSAESLKSIFQNRDFNDSGGFKSASQDPAKSRCNKTEENNTEKSETNPFYSEEDDGMSKREQLEEYFSQSLEIETLLRLCPDDEDTIIYLKMGRAFPNSHDDTPRAAKRHVPLLFFFAKRKTPDAHSIRCLTLHGSVRRFADRCRSAFQLRSLSFRERSHKHTLALHSALPFPGTRVHPD